MAFNLTINLIYYLQMFFFVFLIYDFLVVDVFVNKEFLFLLLIILCFVNDFNSCENSLIFDWVFSDYWTRKKICTQENFSSRRPTFTQRCLFLQKWKFERKTTKEKLNLKICMKNRSAVVLLVGDARCAQEIRDERL